MSFQTLQASLMVGVSLLPGAIRARCRAGLRDNSRMNMPTDASPVQLLTGDWIEQLRTLQSESVHMVCTSPPYYGLRDYGTAVWEGGDTACKHRPPRLKVD